MDMPDYPYHPDPMHSESFVQSAETCECCGWATGLLYNGPIRFTSLKQPVSRICPLCIADGSAAEKFNVTFCDGLLGEPVSDDIKNVVLRQTPGFPSWRQTQWVTHCGDACAFKGPFGWRGLREMSSVELLDSMREHHVDDFEDDEWERLSSSLHRDRGGATAMVFTCRHCGKLVGYVDEL